jgi:hypothetical protein
MLSVQTQDYVDGVRIVVRMQYVAHIDRGEDALKCRMDAGGGEEPPDRAFVEDCALVHLPGSQNRGAEVVARRSPQL